MGRLRRLRRFSNGVDDLGGLGILNILLDITDRGTSLVGLEADGAAAGGPCAARRAFSFGLGFIVDFLGAIVSVVAISLEVVISEVVVVVVAVDVMALMMSEGMVVDAAQERIC